MRLRLDYMDNSEMRRLNRAAGHYWFEPDTMRFFDSRASGGGYVDASGSFAFFVSSERMWPHTDGTRPRRRYSVRVMHLTSGENPRTLRGEVDTVGAFDEYATNAGAHRAARRLAADPSGYVAGLAIDSAREAAQA